MQSPHIYFIDQRTGWLRGEALRLPNINKDASEHVLKRPASSMTLAPPGARERNRSSAKIMRAVFPRQAGIIALVFGTRGSSHCTLCQQRGRYRVACKYVDTPGWLCEAIEGRSVAQAPPQGTSEVPHRTTRHGLWFSFQFYCLIVVFVKYHPRNWTRSELS